MTTWRVGLPDEAATERLGQALAAAILRGMVALEGGLGAGKTTLARGWLRGRGHSGAVRSPTYTLVEPYGELGGGPVFHFDLYRLSEPEELHFIGIDEYVTDEALCLVEWPERGTGVLPEPDLRVRLAPAARGRVAQVSTQSRQDAVAEALEELADVGDFDVTLE